MFKYNTICPKCGGSMNIHWDKGEKTSGMDIKPLRSARMISTCITCGYEEKTEENNKVLAELKSNINER